jgi:Plasmid replication region DNA-binding N-term
MQREEVRAAMVVVLERGDRVTTRTVRNVLGYGSLRDISEHLRALTQEEEPGPSSPDDLFPETIGQEENVHNMQHISGTRLRPQAAPEVTHAPVMPRVAASGHTPHTQAEDAPQGPHALWDRLHALVDAGISVAAIAAQLTADGVPVALGAPRWDRRVVDRCLVYRAAMLRGLEG